LLKGLVEADIVVSSTGAPETILKREEIARILPERRNRPLFLIDIAVPRDIEAGAAELNGVYLYNIDDLEELMQANLRHREEELAQCRAIIEERAETVMAKIAPAPRDFGRPMEGKPGLALQGALGA